MKLRSLLFAILLNCILFLVVQKPAFADWVKNANPVIDPIAWGFTDITQPEVLKEGDTFKMWFAASDGVNWKLGLATSVDGINWTNYTVINNLSSDINVVEPAVVKTSDYKLWFNSYTNGDYKIKFASSPDGTNWSPKPTAVIVPEKPWEIKGVGNPTVIYNDGKYQMWYTGWGFGTPWKLGYAESTDGITWNKSEKNPIEIPNLGHIGGPKVIYDGAKFHLFYHTGGAIATEIYHLISSDGVNWNCEESCSILRTSPENFDSYILNGPAVYFSQNKFYLWYGGQDGHNFRIGLATEDREASVLLPIVLIPGLMGSWNKDALLHNQNVPQSSWKIPEFIKEYKGFVETLIKNGYQEEKDFLVFPYDWRKSINESADDLKNFIDTKIPSAQKIKIVGHSLGGLVGRSFAQKYGTERIDKLITVGSPHAGTAQVYNLVEGGVLERNNNFLWLSEKLILQINKNFGETDRDTAIRMLPAIMDIFPTYNFLKNNDGNLININEMKVKNNVLQAYNSDLNNILPILQTIGGKDINTISGFSVAPRNKTDVILGMSTRTEDRRKLYLSRVILSLFLEVQYLAEILSCLI